MACVGVGGHVQAALCDKALADPGWLGVGALDASVRLVQSVIDAGGLKAGSAAIRLLDALFNETRTSTFDVFRHHPTRLIGWSHPIWKIPTRLSYV